MTDDNETPPAQIPMWLRATAADARSVDIEAPLVGLTEADCHAYSDIFGKSADEIEKQFGGADTPESLVYRMLSALTQMYFKPEESQEPFGPMMAMADGRRTAVPADFRTHVETLAILAERAINPVVKARLSDMCWLLERKRAQQGFAATTAYTQVVRKMDVGELKHRFLEDKGALHHDGRDALLRALHIGHALGADKPETIAARELAKYLRKKCLGEGTLVEVHRFSNLDLDYNISEPSEIGGDIEIVIAKARADGDSHTIVELWRLAARAYGFAKNEEARNRCLNEAAEALVAQADAAKGSAMMAVHFLSLAIVQIGRVPGKKERRTELRHKLVALQEDTLDELSSFSHEMDLSDMAKDVRDRFANGNLLDKLFVFASLSRSANPTTLREDAIRAIQEHPLASLFGTVHMDSEGKVIHRSGGGGMGSDAQEDAIFRQIMQTESIRRGIAVKGSIEAARFALNAQYYLSEDLLGAVLQHSQFVPDDLLATFSRGFSRFFQGDFVSATYILTPLLENSLRVVLKSAGHDVTIFDDAAQTQQDRTISSLFEQMRPELDSIFGVAITSEIERLYLKKPGPHLRHALSHGLLRDGDPYGADAIYGCWLIFQLCMLPLFKHKQQIAEWLRGTDLVPET